jgi:hypothetical protein
MRSPGGEPSVDIRTTNSVAIAGTASGKEVDTIRQMKQEAPDTLVQLATGHRVTAVFADGFYIEDSNRTDGIRVQCAESVAEGSVVKVFGRVSSYQGERYIADGQLIP